MIVFNVPQSIVSPIPANGPINPVFNDVIASPGICLVFAFSSSIAIEIPKIGEPQVGSVLKKFKCLLTASPNSSLFGYNFFKTGMIL